MRLSSWLIGAAVATLCVFAAPTPEESGKEHRNYVSRIIRSPAPLPNPAMGVLNSDHDRNRQSLDGQELDTGKESVDVLVSTIRRVFRAAFPTSAARNINAESKTDKAEKFSSNGGISEGGDSVDDGDASLNSFQGVRMRISHLHPEADSLGNRQDPSLLERLSFAQDVPKTSYIQKPSTYVSQPLIGTESKNVESRTPLPSEGVHSSESTSFNSYATETSVGYAETTAPPLTEAPSMKSTLEAETEPVASSVETETTLGTPSTNTDHSSTTARGDSPDFSPSSGTPEETVEGAPWFTPIKWFQALGDLVISTVSGTKESEGDSLNTAGRQKRVSVTEHEVNTLVDEIIAQVQMRTNDEFKEHKRFLEDEQGLAVRAADGNQGKAPKLHMTKLMRAFFERSGLQPTDRLEILLRVVARLTKSDVDSDKLLW